MTYAEIFTYWEICLAAFFGPIFLVCALTAFSFRQNTQIQTPPPAPAKPEEDE